MSNEEMCRNLLITVYHQVMAGWNLDQSRKGQPLNSFDLTQFLKESANTIARAGEEGFTTCEKDVQDLIREGVDLIQQFQVRLAGTEQGGVKSTLRNDAKNYLQRAGDVLVPEYSEE